MNSKNSQALNDTFSVSMTQKPALGEIRYLML